MVSGTRSGWTRANGHINEPNLAATEAVQNTFYETEFFNSTPNQRVNLNDFRRPNRLVKWAALDAASQIRSERAFFKVNELHCVVHTNVPDQASIDQSIAPPNALFPSLAEFSRILQSRQTQRFTKASCRSYVVETSLLRNAKTAGTLAFKSKIAREQRWLETRGPIIKKPVFTGKYNFLSSFSGHLIEANIPR